MTKLDGSLFDSLHAAHLAAVAEITKDFWMAKDVHATHLKAVAEITKDAKDIQSK